MLKKAVIAALAGGFLTMACAAEEVSPNAIETHTFELGLAGGAAIEGASGDKLGSYATYGIRGSYRFAPEWSIAGTYLRSSNIKLADGSKKVDADRFFADVNYDFYADSDYSPYLIAGLGYEMTKDLENRDGALFDAGLGFRYNFSQHFGANVDAKGKWNLDHADRAVFVTVGLNYLF